MEQLHHRTLKVTFTMVSPIVHLAFKDGLETLVNPGKDTPAYIHQKNLLPDVWNCGGQFNSIVFGYQSGYTGTVISKHSRSFGQTRE